MANKLKVGIKSETSPLPSQHAMSGHHRPSSETPFEWRFVSGPMIARLQIFTWSLKLKKIGKKHVHFVCQNSIFL